MGRKRIRLISLDNRLVQEKGLVNLWEILDNKKDIEIYNSYYQYASKYLEAEILSKNKVEDGAIYLLDNELLNDLQNIISSACNMLFSGDNFFSISNTELEKAQKALPTLDENLDMADCLVEIINTDREIIKLKSLPDENVILYYKE